MGALPPWSEAPRFDAGFWTDAPLVDRAKMVQSRDIEAGGRKRIHARAGVVTLQEASDAVRASPRLRARSLPHWSEVPRFDANLFEAKQSFAGGRRKVHCRDHLDNSAQVDREVVPPTPLNSKMLDNNSGIVRARRSNRDHLKGGAEVDPEAVPATPTRFKWQHLHTERNNSKVDHLRHSVSINCDIVPATPIKQFAKNAEIVEARKAHRDHLVGIAGINLDLVPEELVRHRVTQIPCHLIGGSAEVDPDTIPLEPRRRLQHPASHLCGGGAVLADDADSQMKGRAVLRDWWGNPAHGPGCCVSTPRSARSETRNTRKAPSVAAAATGSPSLPGDRISLPAPWQATLSEKISDVATSGANYSAARGAGSARSSRYNSRRYTTSVLCGSPTSSRPRRSSNPTSAVFCSGAASSTQDVSLR